MAKDKVQLTCKNCDYGFERTAYDVQRNKSKVFFCSQECGYKYREKKSINKIECLFCKKEFIDRHAKRGSSKFCSLKCRHEFSISNRTKKCKNCGKIFQGYYKCCSYKCAGELKSRGEKQKCLLCNKEFYVTPKKIENKQRKYCCRKHYEESLKIVVNCLECGKIFKYSKYKFNKLRTKKYFCSDKCYCSFLINNKIDCSWTPNFNIKACLFFDKLNETLKLNGIHALNEGELKIKNWFLDYYDKENNLAIEWDESHHYSGEHLKDKDKIKQKYIKDNLRCKFYRIKEKDFNEEKEIENIRNILMENE